mmetsp:Transcript_36111/g.80358  ORF Transcript_36111/g.80358 Transcript_36111/m.80358 type:complete len:167 (+) Transcript_36111:107-607(+)
MQFDPLRTYTTEVPITWEKASAWVKECTGESLSNLLRSPETLQRYMDHSAKVKREWRSMHDYLYHSVFCTPAILDDSGKKHTTELELQEASASMTVWRPNDFPYHFEASISHHVLWSSSPLSNEEVEKHIAKNLPGYEAVWFVNPPELQSVRSIWHCHVLARPSSP